MQAQLCPITVLAPFELEEHVAATNDYFRQNYFTLDDLHTYAEPFGAVHKTVQRLSRGSMTDADIVAVIRHAAAQYRAIDDEIEAADAAA